MPSRSVDNRRRAPTPSTHKLTGTVAPSSCSSRPLCVTVKFTRLILTCTSGLVVGFGIFVVKNNRNSSLYGIVFSPYTDAVASTSVQLKCQTL